MDINELIIRLQKRRFNPENEKILQGQIEKSLADAGVLFEREVVLDKGSRIDFMVGDIGIEVKIKGQKREIYKQCERYCGFESIKKLILLTSKSMGIDEEILGKPVYFININRAWL